MNFREGFWKMVSKKPVSALYNQSYETLTFIPKGKKLIQQTAD